MKLVLIFLACFVGLSYQERYIWPSPLAPRAHLMPLFYADGQPAGFDEMKIEPIPTEEKRIPNSGAIVLPSLPSVPPLFTVTTTVKSTVVSTISTPVTSKCIPAANFINATYTTPCARRRREVEHVDSIISPAQPLPLEASAIEPMPETAAASNEAVHPDPAAIESSHEENLIVQRNLKNLTATVSVTSLATSFTFVPAVVKETVTNVAQAAALYCLPAGYIVC